MSTILKALERLEKEKQGGAAGPSPANELAVARPGVPQEPRRRWWLAGAGALVLTGLLALWLRPHVVGTDRAPAMDGGLVAPAEPVPAATVPTAIVAEPAPPRSPAPAPLAAAPEATVQPPPPVVTPAPDPAPGPAREETAPEPQASDLAKASGMPEEPAPAAPIAALEAPPGEPALEPARDPEPVAVREPVPLPEPAPAPIAVEVEPVPPPPPPPARDGEPATAPAPSAKPKPAALAARPAGPRVTVERTIWHPDAARRRAFLRPEGRASAAELREGDSLGEIQVERIEPSGVVFLHEGREVRRAVGARP